MIEDGTTPTDSDSKKLSEWEIRDRVHAEVKKIKEDGRLALFRRAIVTGGLFWAVALPMWFFGGHLTKGLEAGGGWDPDLAYQVYMFLVLTPTIVGSIMAGVGTIGHTVEKYDRLRT